ncbi:MAG: CGNR zinc finger domain-containing protein [Proteobacteria bacterium]|nr:CGNR zinc finger domain-containing protein [Pseudomonadota bacterium]
MTETARPEPFFIADDHALDLLNSVATPWGTEIEWLGDGRDLLAWLEQAGLVPPDVSMRFREKTSPEALDGVAVQARELREWFRAFVAAHAGRRLEPSALADLDKINRLLARDEIYRQIEPRAIKARNASQETQGAHSSSLQWRRHRRWRAPEDLLLPIAEAMGDLICRADFERVRNCEGPTCTLWFHDVSKNHTRRWCMMAVCGNRAKAAAHRARRRAARLA